MIEIKVLPIRQKGFVFYTCVIKAFTLKRICSVAMKDISSENDIYQRSLKGYRVHQIADFVKRENGIMPPAIVLNSRNKLKIKNESIFIDEREDQFFVIDGQHRLAGVFESGDWDFEFCVVIMDCVDVEFQSELFVSINNEQKRVDPNTRFRIKANSGAQTPEKVARNIAFVLNETKNSPFYGMIKTDDRLFRSAKSFISISSFAEPLVYYIYNPDDYFEIRDYLKNNGCVDRINGKLNSIKKYDGKLLWHLYKTDNWETIAKMLFNYFSAIRKMLYFSWDDKRFMVTKTTGYNALMLLFNDVYRVCESNGHNFSYDFMCELLRPLTVFDREITVEKFGLGKVASKNLYLEMLKKVFPDIYKSKDYLSSPYNDFFYDADSEE